MPVGMRAHLPLLLSAALALGGCAATAPPPRSATPPAAVSGRVQTGVASYVGRAYEGRRTASGVRFDGDALAAAHRTLPFGTRVRVTNLANDHAVVVTVVDRGPFHAGRVIDVSRRAAHELGFERAGTTKVRLEVLAARADD